MGGGRLSADPGANAPPASLPRGRALRHADPERLATAAATRPSLHCPLFSEREARGSVEPMPLPDWIDPLYDADEMRAGDAWAIEERGVPSLDLMERAGIGLARVVGGARRQRADPDRGGQGQQRRRRPRGRAATCARRGARWTCSRSPRSRS